MMPDFFFCLQVISKKQNIDNIIGGYSKFWFTKNYYNLIIAMFFDVAVLLSNFNK